MLHKMRLVADDAVHALGNRQEECVPQGPVCELGLFCFV
jgi:hypothetical protein